MNASGRTWTSEVERITPAAKHLMSKTTLSYMGLPWNIRASMTGKEMPITLVKKITQIEMNFRCAAARPSRQLRARAVSITHPAMVVVDFVAVVFLRCLYSVCCICNRERGERLLGPTAGGVH